MTQNKYNMAKKIIAQNRGKLPFYWRDQYKSPTVSKTGVTTRIRFDTGLHHMIGDTFDMNPAIREKLSKLADKTVHQNGWKFYFRNVNPPRKLPASTPESQAKYQIRKMKMIGGNTR